jgi:hypothetical protein
MLAAELLFLFFNTAELGLFGAPPDFLEQFTAFFFCGFLTVIRAHDKGAFASGSKGEVGKIYPKAPLMSMNGRG